jgi:hypothetical protein
VAASAFVESAVGAWEPGNDKNEFRFMFYRFFHSLTETAEKSGDVTPTFAAVQRVRSTNHLTSANAFEGVGESQFLDTDLHVVLAPDGEPMPPVCTLHDGVRMVVEEMDEVCR